MISKFLEKLAFQGWKQKQISEKTGIPQAFISKLQNGANCSLDTLIKIADAFGVTTDEVLNRSPAKTITPAEELLLQTTDGNDEITRAALRSAHGEKLILSQQGERGRGQREKAA